MDTRLLINGGGGTTDQQVNALTKEQSIAIIYPKIAATGFSLASLLDGSNNSAGKWIMIVLILTIVGFGIWFIIKKMK